MSVHRHVVSVVRIALEGDEKMDGVLRDELEVMPFDDDVRAKLQLADLTLGSNCASGRSKLPAMSSRNEKESSIRRVRP